MNAYLNLALLGTLTIIIGMAAGCSSAPKKILPADFTESALAATSDASTNGLEQGSPASQQAVEQFKKFNSDFSTNNILAHTKDVYAADVYFRDPFKEVHGEPDFEKYLLKSAGAVREYSMAWKDVASDQGNYYFRWVMTVRTSLDKKNAAPTRINGMSHVRFNKDGKVIFHEDYYDGADLVYSKVPIIRGMIRHIKKKL